MSAGKYKGSTNNIDMYIYITYLFSYLLTPSNSSLLKNLTALQLVKKFPTFHGTWRFITVFISSRHLWLSWASLIHPITSHPTAWRSILILSSYLRLRLPSGLFPSGFPTKTPYITVSHTCYMSSHIKYTLSGNIKHIFYSGNILKGKTRGQIKHKLDATLCRFYFCRVTLHVSGVKRPIIRSIKKLAQRPLVQVFCKIYNILTLTCWLGWVFWCGLYVWVYSF